MKLTIRMKLSTGILVVVALLGSMNGDVSDVEHLALAVITTIPSLLNEQSCDSTSHPSDPPSRVHWH